MLICLIDVHKHYSKKRKLFLVITLLALFIFSVNAQETEDTSNDPNFDPTANACYTGGSMEGKCDTPEEWEAGWYFIRFEYGLISRENFPSYFSWVLPDEAGESIANCY